MLALPLITRPKSDPNQNHQRLRQWTQTPTLLLRKSPVTRRVERSPPHGGVADLPPTLGRRGTHPSSWTGKRVAVQVVTPVTCANAWTVQPKHSAKRAGSYPSCLCWSGWTGTKLWFVTAPTSTTHAPVPGIPAAGSHEPALAI